MRDNLITLEGNITRDVEMQFSPKGNGYTRNSIAVDKRTRDGDDWKTETSFFDFSILDDKMAENFCETFNKGDRIILAGALQSRTVPVDKDDPDGDKRTFVGIIAENVGASIRWATATVIKNPKGAGSHSTTQAGDDFFDDVK